jgi:hypothetical protein
VAPAAVETIGTGRWCNLAQSCHRSQPEICIVKARSSASSVVAGHLRAGPRAMHLGLAEVAFTYGLRAMTEFRLAAVAVAQ